MRLPSCLLTSLLLLRLLRLMSCFFASLRLASLRLCLIASCVLLLGFLASLRLACFIVVPLLSSPFLPPHGCHRLCRPSSTALASRPFSTSVALASMVRTLYDVHDFGSRVVPPWLRHSTSFAAAASAPGRCLTALAHLSQSRALLFFILLHL